MTAPALTEAQFQRQVIEYALWRRYKVFHNADSRRTQAGIPDLLLIRPPQVLWIELKTEKGRVRPEQAEMIADLRSCNQVAAVYRPSQWPLLKAILDDPSSWWPSSELAG